MGEMGGIRSRSNTGPGRLGMSGSSLPMTMPHQGYRRVKRSMDRGPTRSSGERLRIPHAAVVGGSVGVKAARKSVENW